MHDETPSKSEQFVLNLMESDNPDERAIAHLAHDITEACVRAEVAGLPRETVMGYIRMFLETKSD